MADNDMSHRQRKNKRQKLDNKEKMVNPEVCLSNLPDDMLSHVLSFLNLKEAFRTRLVSRSWRYLWVPTRHLKIDSELIFGCDNTFKSWSYSHKTTLYRSTKEKTKQYQQVQGQFVERVERLLSLLTCPKLLSFTVSFCLGKESAYHVDEWIRHAVRRESGSINLDFIFTAEGLPRDEIELFDFPCHLLPLGEGSNLKHLCLKECNLRPSHEQANRFNSLKSLKLVNVALKESVVEVILSGCLKLERLELAHCSMLPALTICGQVPCLKWLHVDSCMSLKKIEIRSVNLQTFEFWGTDTKFFFSDAPMLAEVYVWLLIFSQHGWDYVCDGELARGVPQLQNLYLNCSIHQIDHISPIMTEFRCLKQLEIHLRALPDFDIFKITHLLNASPVLEKFKICLLPSTYDGAIESNDYCCGQGQAFRHLKEVQITGFCEKWNAVGFTIHLLKNAALERLIVSPKYKIYYWSKKQFDYYSQQARRSLSPEHVYNLLYKECADSRVELIVL